MSNTVDVISQRTFKIVAQFPTGELPQHVTPAYNLKTLYVDNDLGNSLTPIDPRTGKPGTPIPVEDPYNLYFTPDGRSAIVVEERLQTLAFRNPNTMRARAHAVRPDVPGDRSHGLLGRRALRIRQLRICRADDQDRPHHPESRLHISAREWLLEPPGRKAFPDGTVLYTADQAGGGLWEINPNTFKLIGFLHTGAGAHGLYPSRNAKLMYVSNRPRARSRSSASNPKGRRHLGHPAASQPRHGRRLHRWQHALAERTLQRRGLRDRHANRPAAGADPGRTRTARPRVWPQPVASR